MFEKFQNPTSFYVPATYTTTSSATSIATSTALSNATATANGGGDCGDVQIKKEIGDIGGGSGYDDGDGVDDSDSVSKTNFRNLGNAFAKKLFLHETIAPSPFNEVERFISMSRDGEKKELFTNNFVRTADGAKLDKLVDVRYEMVCPCSEGCGNMIKFGKY